MVFGTHTDLLFDIGSGALKARYVVILVPPPACVDYWA